MSTPRFYASEITPEEIEKITQKARRERSEALWRILQSIFGSRAADDELPKTLGTAAPRSTC